MNLDLSSYFPTFRGPLRSSDLNSAFKEISEFLGVAIAQFQRLKSKDDIYRLAIGWDIKAVVDYLNSIVILQNTMNSNAKVLYRSFSSGTDTTSNGIDPILNIDTTHGLLTLPEVQRTSFIMEIDGDWNEKVPDPFVKVYLDDVLKAEGQTIRNFLCKSPENIWVAESTSGGSRTIKIIIPRSSQISPNYLIFDPLPTYKEIISGVLFRDFNASLATPYAGFPATISKKTILHFSNSAFRDEVRFSLTPWHSEGKYIYGMRFFDLGHITHASSGAIRFQLSNGDMITDIIGISHIPQNGSFVQPGPDIIGFLDQEPVSIRIFADASYSSLLWSNSTSYPSETTPIPVGDTVLYVEVEMKKVSDTTPTLSNLMVAYT